MAEVVKYWLKIVSFRHFLKFISLFSYFLFWRSFNINDRVSRILSASNVFYVELKIQIGTDGNRVNGLWLLIFFDALSKWCLTLDNFIIYVYTNACYSLLAKCSQMLKYSVFILILNITR